MIDTQEIVVYGTESCAPCKTAKQFLDRKGIPYVYKDVDKDPEALNQMLYHSDNRYDPPVVVTPKGVMVSFSIQRLVEIL